MSPDVYGWRQLVSQRGVTSQKAKFPLLVVLVVPTSHFPAFLFAVCRIPYKFDFFCGRGASVYFLNREFVFSSGDLGARHPVNPHFARSPHYTGQKYSVRPGATYGNTCAIRGSVAAERRILLCRWYFAAFPLVAVSPASAVFPRRRFPSSMRGWAGVGMAELCVFRGR